MIGFGNKEFLIGDPSPTGLSDTLWLEWFGEDGISLGCDISGEKNGH